MARSRTRRPARTAPKKCWGRCVAEPRGDVVVRSFTGGVFAENSYLLVCTASNAAILVDPGAGTPRMLAEARRLGVNVEAIVLTHAHIDHVEGLAQAKEETG